MDEKVVIGNIYIYMKEACRVKAIEKLAPDPMLPGHEIFRVEALDDYEPLEIKKGDKFEAIDGELLW